MVENGSDINWYAFFTRPRSEKKLAKQFENKGVTYFLPLYTEVRQWSDRKKKVTEPLLKRIIFVKSTIEDLHTFYSFHHIISAVKEFGQPAVIKEHEIKTLEIIAREWSGETIASNQYTDYVIGDEVEIKRGPLTGLTGKLLEIKGKHRLVVQLETLNVEFTVDIAKSQTKKLSK
jgi:transcription antitermination factor NusG